MKILYILIFSVLFFDPSHCQDALNGKDDEEGKEVYSATSDLVKDDSLHHPRSTRSLLLSEKLDSLRDKRILTKKNKLTDFLPKKFQHILRVMNTNIDGKRKAPVAMTAIKGVGRRYSTIVLKKAGEMTDEEVEKVITIILNSLQYKIPNWFLNRHKDCVDGKFTQLTSSDLDSKLREDLERLKKIHDHRGMRHFWGLRVRGQHTKTTGRRGRTVGVSKKK